MRYCFLLILCSISLTACTVTQQSETDLLLKKTMQQRTALQFQYAQLSDEYWQRTGTLFKEESQLPIRSKQLTTLQKINQNLQLRIDQLTAKLTTLNNKIDATKQSISGGEIIKINLVQGLWQQTQNVAQNELILVAGEKATWQLFQQDQIALPEIEIILSEKGHLYMDGQKVATIPLNTSSSIELNRISLFAQQPFAVGQITMSLIIQRVN